MGAVSLLSVSLRDARADQPTLAGSWSAGPLIENVTVTSWVDECGPKPKSNSAPGGGYKITVSGDELVFSGGKSFRTDQCWDMGLARRVSHSATPAIRWWKTRCESPPGDPRTAAITTVVRAVDDDTIVLSETARYSSTLASGTCAANVERSRTFKIVSREGAPAPTPSVTATVTATATAAPTPTVTAKPPPPTVDCSSPGELATLEVKPRKKRVRPGEQFDFKARLLDAKGCEVAGKPTFRLSPDSSSITTIAIDNTGHVKVSADAEPVLAGIVVEAAGKSAKVELEVMSDQAYADLLAAGGGDAGADESAVAIVVSSGGGGETKVVDPGKPEEGRRRFAYLAIAGGFVTLLALGAIVLWRRGNAKVEQEKARREAEREAARAKRDAEKRAAAPPAGSRQCPTCRTVLPPHAQFCPNDGTPLGPAPAQAPAASAAPPFQPPPPPAAARPRGRICPLCGARYEAEAAFCSKDGASLVPLN